MPKFDPSRAPNPLQCIGDCGILAPMIGEKDCGYAYHRRADQAG
jgi:hypothetical protein